MRRRLLLALIGAVCATACGTVGVPRAARLPMGMAAVADHDDKASGYLALEFVPTPEVTKLVASVIGPLGFVDPGHMIPPRDPDVLHATVAFFHKPIPEVTQEQLAKQFKGQTANLTINGTGVAAQQVAYLTLEGLQPARDALRSLSLAGEEDDPHATIGASPSNPRDLHGVPKPPQHAVTPIVVTASYHFYYAAGGPLREPW